MNPAPPGMYVVSMDHLYAGGGKLLENAWVVLDKEGMILDLGEGNSPLAPHRHIKGLVWGGLVNSHCHLELSHLHGKVPEQTGMAGFVLNLQVIRGNFSEKDAVKAAGEAALSMLEGGIRGVADICNGLHSLSAKQQCKDMFFHSFVEVFGLNPAGAEDAFQRAFSLAEAFGERASITLHAPYSVSTALRDKVQSYARAREWPQSLHLLESQEERQLFESLDGPLMDMIRSFKAPFPGHESHSPLEYLLQGQPRTNKTLLVHLVEVTEDEAHSISSDFCENAFVVVCPRANLFIHGKLPPLDILRRAGMKICIGTDSLAGNWSLDLWAEIRLIQAKFDVHLPELLTWAIDHGVEALGFPREKFIPSIGCKFEAFQMENYIGKTGSIPENPIINIVRA